MVGMRGSQRTGVGRQRKAEGRSGKAKCRTWKAGGDVREQEWEGRG